jgi:pyrimidine deaminase RibD-like protein
VVTACADPSPKASRRGLDRLCAAGVEVEDGVLAAESEALYGADLQTLAKPR